MEVGTLKHPPCSVTSAIRRSTAIEPWIAARLLWLWTCMVRSYCPTDTPQRMVLNPTGRVEGAYELRGTLPHIDKTTRHNSDTMGLATDTLPKYAIDMRKHHKASDDNPNEHQVPIRSRATQLNPKIMCSLNSFFPGGEAQYLGCKLDMEMHTSSMA